MIYVESEAGEVATGTAFAVRPNGTLLTNRHVVAGPQGNQRARRIAVQFSDSEQVWPARILAVSQDADLAVIRVENIIGRVPTVRSLNLRPDTIAQGTAVAWIGFPLGGEADGPGSQGTARVAKPVLSAGVVSGMSSGRLEVQGYGAEGSSGSPLFDANGQVIGILLGGRAHRGGHTVYGVPASVAAKLLNSVR
jgi:S1-C subfamily serine protease